MAMGSTLRKITWRVKDHSDKLNVGTYAQIIELERRIKILDD